MGPPEIIAATFEAGPGPASTLANQLVWVTEVVNHELVMGLSAGNTAATSSQWIGLGGVASAATATELNAGLQTLVGWISHKVAVTQVAVEAFAVAASTVIPSLVCQANRDEWAVLNATNFLGINTPAIVGLDTEYFGEHYPHNSGIGWTYSAALGAVTATLALPPPIAPLGASPAAPAAAGETSEALAQAATDAVANDITTAPGGAAGLAIDDAGATAGGADISGFGSQLPQLLSGLTQPLEQIAQAPAQLAQAAASPAQSLVGSFGSFSGGMFPAAPGHAAVPGAAVPEAAATVEPWRAGTATPVGPGNVGGYPLGLTRYTQPSNSFAPENAGRPSSLRAGLLDTTPRGVAGRLGGGPPLVGAGMPVTPLSALHREPGDADRDAVTHVRIVVDADRNDR